MTLIRSVNADFWSCPLTLINKILLDNQMIALFYDLLFTWITVINLFHAPIATRILSCSIRKALRKNPMKHSKSSMNVRLRLWTGVIDCILRLICYKKPKQSNLPMCMLNMNRSLPKFNTQGIKSAPLHQNYFMLQGSSKHLNQFLCYSIISIGIMRALSIISFLADFCWPCFNARFCSTFGEYFRFVASSQLIFWS